MIETLTEYASVEASHPSGCRIFAECDIVIREDTTGNNHGPDIGIEPWCEREAVEVVAEDLHALADSGCVVALPDDWRECVADWIAERHECGCDPAVIFAKDATDAE